MSQITQTINEFPYSDSHQDGLLDIFMGLFALMAGLFLMTDMFYLVGVVPAIFLPGWQSARKKSLKRQGVSDIAISHQSRVRLIFLFALSLGFLTFTAALGMSAFVYFNQIPAMWFEWIREFALIVLGAIFASMMAFSAYMTGIRRLYTYAFLLLLAFIFAYFIGLGLPWLMIGYGVVLLASGVVLLVRFLQNYPSS